MHYKNFALQFGDAIKWDSSVNQIARCFAGLTSLSVESHPTDFITSARAQTVYDWVLTVAESDLSEAEKGEIYRHAVLTLVPEVEVQERLLKLLDAPRLPVKTGTFRYVNEARINDLRLQTSAKFDFRKLIRLCEELNAAFDAGSYLNTIMTVRAIIDHVPPIFGCAAFGEIEGKYAGSRSFKESMRHLNQSSRKIADQYLHGQIRARESLPNHTQVDFSNDLDVLLAEIHRISR